MIDINSFLQVFCLKLEDTFSDRVLFVGLQGSYGRGEATENSDIDIVVILDKLTPGDIQIYNAMLDTLPDRQLICGFLSGKNDIKNWFVPDLFQFYFDTKPIKGSLDDLLIIPDDKAVRDAVKISVCNIYHGCVHNMLYDKSEEILKGLYKSALFTIQALCFLQTGKYICKHIDILEVAYPSDIEILKTYFELKSENIVMFDEMSEKLFNWCQRLLEGELIYINGI